MFKDAECTSSVRSYNNHRTFLFSFFFFFYDRYGRLLLAASFTELDEILNYTRTASYTTTKDLFK